MTRFTSTSMQAAAEESLVAFRLLADIGVTSSTIYFCTGRQFIYANAHTYSPVGGLGGISNFEEESDVFPRDVTMTLAAVNTADLYEPLRESMFGRPVTFYRTFLNTTTFVSSDAPEKIWKGEIASVEYKPEEAQYEVRAVSALRKTALIQYFNRETFTAIDSSDTFGNHVDQIPLFRSQWGGETTRFNGSPQTNMQYGTGRFAGVARPVYNPDTGA